MFCDKDGAYGFGKQIEESTWCCSFHGELGFIQIRKHLLSRSEGLLTCRFALDFCAVDRVGTTTSVLRPGQKPGEVLRQRLSLAGQPATAVRVRQPHWANKVRAVVSTDTPLALQEKDGWFSTAVPVTEVEFIFDGNVYTENRRCERLSNIPRSGDLFVIGYGPRLLVSKGRSPAAVSWPSSLDILAEKGLVPLSSAMRCEECSFVFSIAN